MRDDHTHIYISDSNLGFTLAHLQIFGVGGPPVFEKRWSL